MSAYRINKALTPFAAGIKPSVLRASYRAMLDAAPRLDATVRSGGEG